MCGSSSTILLRAGGQATPGSDSSKATGLVPDLPRDNRVVHHAEPGGAEPVGGEQLGHLPEAEAQLQEELPAPLAAEPRQPP